MEVLKRLSLGGYGIRFYPEMEGAGCIELAYGVNFGVCGTGLEEETVKLAGDLAYIGYYDGSKIWDFIRYDGKNEGIVANACMSGKSWNLYEEQIMDILDTLVFDPDDQSGAIGVFEPDSEIEALWAEVSVKEITGTKAALYFGQYDKDVTAELSFGEDFVMERKEGDEWKEAPVILEGNYGFNDAAHIIQKEDTTKFVYDWGWLYGELEPGDYRIRVNVLAQESGGYDRYTAYAHFIVR